MRVAEPQLDAAIAPAEGVLVRRSWQKHLLTFLMVFGPGLIVMEADNDAGAVSTYMQAGGQYGLHLLWLLIVLPPICYFVQEMVARFGIATGKGHAAMIYERFGKWWGHFSLLDLEAGIQSANHDTGKNSRYLEVLVRIRSSWFSCKE